MSIAEPYALSCWYVNIRRVLERVDSAELDALLSGVNRLYSREIAPPVFVPLLRQVSVLMLDWMKDRDVPPIEQLIGSNSLAPGALFTTYRRFYFRGLGPWRDHSNRPNDPPPKTLPLMYAKLDEFDPAWRLEAPYHPEHLTSSSAWSELSGNGRFFLFGYIRSIENGVIDARPFAVCDLIADEGLFSPTLHFYELHIDSIESFALASDEPTPSKTELLQLKAIPEEAVKNGFAEIIDEPVVPKDWGGEMSDLFSTHVRFDGKRVSAAFAFKGPAKFSEMTLAHLGKNGDQIERLFNEPADLLFLQHCHGIHRSVRSMMRAYATRVQQQRHFCLVDGFDTLRVLRAYSKCGL